MPSKEEYWSGEFDECPNCGCTNPGTTIYKCKENLVTSEGDHCGKVFCNECGKITLMSFGHGGNEGCPSCGSFGSTIGKISRSTSSSSSNDDNSGTKIIGWLIGVGIVVFVVIWLAVNVVLPVALLNSALVLTILALVYKQREILFAALALVGGAYMLFDISNGWFSASFVNNVVKDKNWISGFVYINSVAMGFSAWFLVQPIWLNAKQVAISDKKKSIFLMSTSILLVALALLSVPILYNTVQNPFNIPKSGGNTPKENPSPQTLLYYQKSQREADTKLAREQEVTQQKAEESRRLAEQAARLEAEQKTQKEEEVRRLAEQVARLEAEQKAQAERQQAQLQQQGQPQQQTAQPAVKNQSADDAMLKGAHKSLDALLKQ